MDISKLETLLAIISTAVALATWIGKNFAELRKDIQHMSWRLSRLEKVSPEVTLSDD